MLTFVCCSNSQKNAVAAETSAPEEEAGGAAKRNVLQRAKISAWCAVFLLCAAQPPSPLHLPRGISRNPSHAHTCPPRLKHAGFTYKHYLSHHPGPLILRKNKKSPTINASNRPLRTRTNKKTRKTLPTISCGRTSPTRMPARPHTSPSSGRARPLDTASTISPSHYHADATTRTSPLPTPLVPSHHCYRAP